MRLNQQLTIIHRSLITMAYEGKIVLREGKYWFVTKRGLRTDYLTMLPEQASCFSELLEWEILLPAKGENRPVQVSERNYR